MSEHLVISSRRERWETREKGEMEMERRERWEMRDGEGRGEGDGEKGAMER